MNMKKSMAAIGAGVLVLIAFDVRILALSMAQQAEILDAKKHPMSPQYQSLFSDPLLPLDTKISWTKRFTGDENFNPEQTLQPINSDARDKPISDSAMAMSADQGGSGLDGVGEVKKVDLGQGKIKIKHGAIDKLGMPAMTMVFKVSDPALLDNLVKGAIVDFNVDSSAGGFVITDIKPTQP